MGETEDQVGAIRELFDISLLNKEFAFVFLDYSGIVLRTVSKNVCFDPGMMLKKEAIAEITSLDLTFYTHSHHDHFTESVAKQLFEKTNAHVIAETLVFEELRGKIPENKLTLADVGKLNKTHTIEGFEVTCIKGTHPRSLTQFKVDLGDMRIFHPGDSGYMKNSKRSDIAFLPTGMPSPTCSPDVAIAMAREVKPKVVVATHGTTKQMEQFRKLMERDLPKIRVIIPEESKVIRSSL
jgi:L-ascorbate metabolism protein UlaG (beta-lactamase superfamily)